MKARKRPPYLRGLLRLGATWMTLMPGPVAEVGVQMTKISIPKGQPCRLL